MKPIPPRIHLLPARAAPVVVALVRVRAKVYHVLRIDARSGAVEAGSWFRGRIYEKRCDVSFDGRWLVYFAMGSRGEVWNGVAELPWLRTMIDVPQNSTYFGGGVFTDAETLRANQWLPDAPVAALPFRITAFDARPANGEDLGPLYRRLERDGYVRAAAGWGTEHEVDGRRYRTRRDGDPGWIRRPSPRHPCLRVRYVGYDQGYRFACDLDPARVDLAGAEWACWDSADHLWVARGGRIERWDVTLRAQEKPIHVIDCTGLTPPPRPPAESPPPPPDPVPTPRRIDTGYPRRRRP